MNRLKLEKSVVVVWFLVCSFIGEALGDTQVRSQLNMFEQQLAQFHFRPVMLDARRFFDLLKDDPSNDIRSLTQIVNNLQEQTTSNFCDEIKQQALLFRARLMLQRQRLVSNQLVKYTGSFATMPNGKKWYQHWLTSWLGDNVTLQELERIALAELQEVEKLEQTLGLTNVDYEEAAQVVGHKAIIEQFKQRQLTVSNALPTVFGMDFGTLVIGIESSGLGDDFPAPGFYDPVQQTFYYHAPSGVMPSYVLDWLFIHEALPGHHLQYAVTQKQRICNSFGTELGSMGVQEGWAAFVETIGSELGLYKDKQSQKYALFWQKLRAVRVLIDIAIHAKGSNQQDSLAIWSRYISNQQALFEREFKRMKEWPAQVITYVYGKSIIEQAIKSPQISAIPLSKRLKVALLFTSLPPQAMTAMPAQIENMK